MTDPIKDSAELALRWIQDEAQAYANACRWLTQSSAGLTPTDMEMPNDNHQAHAAGASGDDDVGRGSN